MPKTLTVKNKECRLLESFPDLSLVYGFSTRKAGNMSLCYGDTRHSLENRRDFLKGLGIDCRDLVCAKQAHGSNVAYIQEFHKGKGAVAFENSLPDTDGFITDKQNLPLAIFTADCLSIFLYDYKAAAIGLVHAGWRSAKENIAGKTASLMQEKFNTRPQDLYIGFGSAIRSCCYEVAREFSSFFPDGLTERNNHYYLDLVEVNKKQILASGAKEENIFDSGLCTSCRNEEFFSYRKEGSATGRMMSVIMLK